MRGLGSPRSGRLVAGLAGVAVLGAIFAVSADNSPRASHGATRASTVQRPPAEAIRRTRHPRTRPRRAAARIEGPYGRSASAVWIVVPNRPVRSVVVFGHGWKLIPPSPTYSWVGQFRPWLEHLAGGGSAVIFPRYQLGVGDAQDASRVRDFAAGIRTAYALLGRPRVPVVAVGYSFGASLAFYYGANAGAWGLPAPRAVQAVFPAGMIAGARLPALGRTVRVLIQVGEADTEAGSAGANSFWTWLAHHPNARKRYELVRSEPGLPATHAAPKSATAAAQRTFWAPLDRLIAAATG